MSGVPVVLVGVDALADTIAVSNIASFALEGGVVDIFGYANPSLAVHRVLCCSPRTWRCVIMSGEASVMPSEIPLLKLIPPGRVAEILIIRRYRVGEHVFSQDDATTGLWFVQEGRVAVERIGVDGTLTTTGVWAEGDIVGIAGLWDRSGYPASARALSNPTTLGWIARDIVLRLHQEVPQFGLEISRLLSERLRFIQESVSNRQGRPIINQVASVLLTLSSRMGPTIKLTHEDLAHIIGTHRETVSRALHELTRDGVVDSHHGNVAIMDGKKLEVWSAGVSR